MTLTQLKYIVETAETGTISKAAEKMYISQPSLTAAIRELEHEFGITIFQLRVFTDPGTPAFTYLLVVFAIPLVLVYVSKRQCRRVYNANPQLQERHSVMRFYEDHLQETSNHQSVDVPYSSIAHLVETRTHFYLMTAANQGMIIIKKNCSAELIQFLHELKQ